MQITEQTTTDVAAIVEILDQNIHEQIGTPDATNRSNPAEVAALCDLRDQAKALLGTA